MANDPSVPAAIGNVGIRRDKANGNTEFRLKVENLANPARLTPPASVYVVWVRQRDGQPQKEGVIQVDRKFNGSMDATTTIRDGDLFITPEDSPAATAPSGIQVLLTHFSV
jgi:hypothetical protein